jgi:S-adenosylmethionine decarboxylase
MDSLCSKIPERPPFLGRQLHLDLEGCPHELLDDVGTVEATLLSCAKAIKATVVQSTFHQFSPQGVSGVVVIMESHIAIHTWPEYGYAAVDIFTCGDMDLEPGIHTISEQLKAQFIKQRLLMRGEL